MNRHKLIAPFALVSLVLLAAACGGGGTASMAPAPARGGLAQGAQAQAGQAAVSAGQKPGADALQPALPPGTRVQSTAQLTIDVADGRFESTFDDVITLVGQAGGYISGSNAQVPAEGQALRTGQATFQVPADKLTSVLTAIRRLGKTQVINQGGTDVSQQYVDLQARLRNAEAQRDVMLALMQQARTINDTIQIENQLGQVTGQIEQLKGQIDYLVHTTTYATLSVTIREAAAVSQPDQWGVQSAAAQALHNFVSVVAFLIVALGTLLPLLVVGAVLLVVGRSAWRRLSARAAG